MSDIFEMIKRHEGTGPMEHGRFMPYKDTMGLTTIGWGRCIERIGISKEEAEIMITNDIAERMAQLRHGFLWFDDLDSVRQDVLIDMCYQLGFAGLLKFVMTLKHIEKKEYDLAADCMVDSKWARNDSPNRAKELAEMMRTGKYV
jgi:lysozyme